MSEAFRAENLAYLEAAEEDWDPKESDKREINQAGSESFEYSDSDGIFESMVSTSSSLSRAPPTSSQRMSSSKASRELHRIRFARARHRKRRYNVLSKFLLDCAGYLMLEKGQAKAFLPMLTRLLVPKPPTQKPEIHESAEQSRRKTSSFFAKKPENSTPTGDMSTASESEGRSSPAEKILSQISESPVDDFSSLAHDIYEREVNEIEHFRPFLESMTSGGGFRCLALVMLQHLLNSREGYDARVRSSIKRLGVLLLVHEMENDPTQIEADRLAAKDRPDLVTLASRRFESLEHEIALRIIKLSRNQQVQTQSESQRSQRQTDEPRKGVTRQQIMRGLKVGAVGVAAGSLFAVTGGLAAPGIAAGLAAIAGGTAATAATAAVLTSTAAVTAIFGVGGGTLVAYKMNRRTQGVTEFEFRKESLVESESEENQEQSEEAELFSTIAVSGWLRDFCDFQRPWGVSPTNPWISDQVELLERFYSVHRPENIIKSEKILKSWEGEEKELWNLLKQKYGSDPDHLFPITDGQRKAGALTLEQQEVLDQLLVVTGYVSVNEKVSQHKRAPLDRIRSGWKRRHGKSSNEPISEAASNASNPEQAIPLVSGAMNAVSTGAGSTTGGSTVSSLGFESVSTDFATSGATAEAENEVEVPKHIATVWDYKSTYGGELYTIRWESELLKELCDSVSDLAFDLVSGGTAQILKHTALSALMSAVAWPYALVNAANMIDGTWTLAVERSDEAGRELARSLLFSRAGHRPVTLVGFSFGARAIYSCLKELARYQEKWCDYQEALAANPEVAYDGGDDDEESFRNMREPASIVEDAIVMGLPNHMSLTSWRVCRQVVAGRLVNCFSQKDLILSLMFQFKRLKLKPVCGTCPIAISGVENIDVTESVLGHEQYCTSTGNVLKKIRHGQPFRSRPAHTFDPVSYEESSDVPDKFDV